MLAIVARTGDPISPNTSQSVTGHTPISGSGIPWDERRFLSFSVNAPGWEIPVRSPFTSAMKTGTPMRENCSAITCSVTVLPVPVAPVIQPWRLA